jgi:hypothetical protein
MTRAPTPRRDCTWCKGTGVAHTPDMMPGETALCPCPLDARAGAFAKWPPRERTGIPEPSEDLRLADGLRSWTGPK